MGKLMSLEQRPPKDDKLRKSHQENIDSDVISGYFCKVEQI